MLRITRQPGADHDTLLLEGKLLKEWLKELKETLAQTRQDGAVVGLDLSGLSFIDGEAARFLRDCRKHGVSLLRASPFVKALLDPPPRRRSPS
jgi:ABC-type transporter Mla MlaB component